MTQPAFTVILQYRGGGHFAAPHDSTVGVGPGFYWFAAGFLLFIVGGTLKAYYDDKKWDGKVMKMMSQKGRKNSDRPAQIVVRDANKKGRQQN